MFLEKFPYRVKFYTKKERFLRLTGRSLKKGGAAGVAGCVEGLCIASLREGMERVLKMDQPRGPEGS